MHRFYLPLPLDSNHLEVFAADLHESSGIYALGLNRRGNFTAIKPQSIPISFKHLEIIEGLKYYMQTLRESEQAPVLKRYLQSYQEDRGTFGNLLAYCLELRQSLSEGDAAERLSWDFIKLMQMGRLSADPLLLASDGGLRINPNLETLKIQFWEEKKGLWALWVNENLELRQRKLNVAEQAVIEELQEGLRLDMDRDSVLLNQLLADQIIYF